MNSVTTLRIACAGLLASVACPFPAIAQVQAVVERPARWVVSAAPVDPALASLSEEELIDRLRDTEPAVGPKTESMATFWPMSGEVILARSVGNVRVHSPAAVELVRRGSRSLPALLDHLTDARPTKLVYAVPKPVANRKDALAFSDEYEPRVNGATAPAGTNTGGRTPLDDSGLYTFRVGDLCYATLGQIVNRDLRAVRGSGENAMIFSGVFSSNPGDWFMTVNSPVQRPALAAAARADWGGITREAHADSLRDDFLRPAPKPPPNVVTRAWTGQTDAITRLLYYYPNLGTELAEAHLGRKLTGAGAPYRPNPDEGLVSPLDQSRFVASLAAFRSDRLQAALLGLFRQAAAQAEGDLRSLPAGTWDPSKPSLGGDLALVCARQLIHQGHDDELKVFFSARVAAIELAIKAPEPALGKNFGGVNFVNAIQAGECRKFLAELEFGSANPPVVNQPAPADSPPVMADARVRLGPVSLDRKSHGVVVTLSLVEPAPGRVFAGRVIIDRARDDLGVTLWPEPVGPLAPIAVGGSGEAEMLGLPKASFAAALTRAAPQAGTLALLEGRLELVVPDFDPDSVVVVKDIAGKIGSPLESKALQAAHLAITIHDRTTARAAEQSLHAGGQTTPTNDAQKPYFRVPPYEAGDVVLSLSDPDGRFLNVEFRDADGHSLRYNHNGWSHRDSGRGTRSDVYRLGDQIPAGTQMVVWLRTKKSHLVVPLKVTNLSLPEAAASGR